MSPVLEKDRQSVPPALCPNGRRRSGGTAGHRLRAQPPRRSPATITVPPNEAGDARGRLVSAYAPDLGHVTAGAEEMFALLAN